MSSSLNLLSTKSSSDNLNDCQTSNVSFHPASLEALLVFCHRCNKGVSEEAYVSHSPQLQAGSNCNLPV